MLLALFSYSKIRTYAHLTSVNALFLYSNQQHRTDAESSRGGAALFRLLIVAPLALLLLAVSSSVVVLVDALAGPQCPLPPGIEARLMVRARLQRLGPADGLHQLRHHVVGAYAGPYACSFFVPALC